MKRATRTLLLSGGWLLLGVAAAAAAGNGDLQPPLLPPAGDPFSPWPLMFKALGALILIIGLMLFIAAALRKLGLQQGGGGRGELLRVIETRPIGPRKYLAVVAAAGDYFLLGVADQQINLLSRLENREEIERRLREQGQGQGVDTGGGGFAGVLAGALKRRPGERLP